MNGRLSKVDMTSRLLKMKRDLDTKSWHREWGDHERWAAQFSAPENVSHFFRIYLRQQCLCVDQLFSDRKRLVRSLVSQKRLFRFVIVVMNPHMQVTAHIGSKILGMHTNLEELLWFHSFYSEK